MAEINQLKEKGNTALRDGRHDEAIESYTKAINLDPKNHLLYSNRSAAYLKAGKYEESLQDANKTIELNPSWAKGYSRKVDALRSLEKYDDGFETFKEGLKYDPERSQILQKDLSEVKRLFSELYQTPMDIDPSSPSANSNDNSSDKNKRLAKEEKELGNIAYKKKDFDAATKHYLKAIEYDPNDITFYSNLSAVYFEKKEYEKCIAECEKGIEIGRENRADYKLIAKAFTRIGNAYRKLNDSKSAKIYYEKSLSEHRTPEVKTLLSQVEAIIKEEERRAFIDPELAEIEKEKGNELFKKGDFSTAVKHYTQAINRNPEDPKLYSNRAACYTKLAAFDLGLKDCDTCTSLDENFIKGYIRKGKILQGMQQPSKALAAYQKALSLDPTNNEALEGYRTCSMAVQNNPEEMRKKVMNDPEIQQILKDPAMRLILEQMQSDPKAVEEHLRNPAVASKIQKLFEAGIIQLR